MKPIAALCLVVLLTSLLQLPDTEAPSCDAFSISIIDRLSFDIIEGLSFDGLRAAGFNLAACSPVPFSARAAEDDKENLTVHFLDVGQGDSILIQFGNRSMLIDGGQKEMGRRVVSYLKEQGVKEIDLLVLTHPHEDHVGGLISVLESFEVRKVLDSGQAHTSKTYERFLDLVDKKGIPYQVASRGMRLDLAPQIVIEVLAPPSGGLGDDLNENSVVLKAVYGNVSLLLTGDADIETESYLRSSGSDLNSDILKVGHHGSKTSSSSAFLKAVTPDISVISVGAGNLYSHPSDEAMNRLKGTGSMIYRTDLDGNLTATTDGVSFYIYSSSYGSNPSRTITPRSIATDEGTETEIAATKKAPGSSQSNVPASVQISAVHTISVQFDAPGDDRKNLNGEWVRIYNSGPGKVQLKGWTLFDEGEKNAYTFPDFMLSPRSAVTVFTGTGENTEVELYMGRRAPIWDNDGDLATLMRADGVVVDSTSD